MMLLDLHLNQVKSSLVCGCSRGHFFGSPMDDIIDKSVLFVGFVLLKRTVFNQNDRSYLTELALTVINFNLSSAFCDNASFNNYFSAVSVLADIEGTTLSWMKIIKILKCVTYFLLYVWLM